MCCVNHLAGVLQEGLAGSGERDLAFGAIKQRHAEFFAFGYRQR